MWKKYEIDNMNLICVTYSPEYRPKYLNIIMISYYYFYDFS